MEASQAIANGNASELSDLIAACELFMESPALAQEDGHEDLAQLQTVCGLLSMERFRVSVSRADIDRAYELLQAAVELIPGRAILWHNVSAALRERYASYGDEDDLDEARDYSQRSIELGGEHDDLGMYMSGFISNLVREYERRPQVEILTQAAAAATEMVRRTPPDHPAAPERISRLASIWQMSFEHAGDVTALRKSIEFEELIQDVSARYGHNLSVTNLLLYRRTGDRQDLERAVEHGRAAMAATRPEEAVFFSRLTTLVGALLAHYEESGEQQDLNEALELSGAALANVDRAPAALVRRLRAIRTSCLRELVEIDPADWVVEALREELHEKAEGEPSEDALRELAEIEESPGDRLADPEGVDRAVAEAEQALAGLPPRAPARYKWLATLGNALTDRYEVRGNVSDLTRAVAVLEPALSEIPPSDLQRSRLAGALAAALMRRNEHQSDNRDLDRAIGHSETAFELVRTQNQRSRAAANLSFLLSRRAVKERRLDDARRAVEVSKPGITLTPRRSPAWVVRANNYANALYALWRVGADPAVLEELRAKREEVASATSRDGEHFSVAHRNLAVVYRHLFADGGDRRWLDLAKLAYRETYEVAVEREVSEALAAAEALAEIADGEEDWREAQVWHSRCLDAIERLVVSQLARPGQFSWLREVQGTAARAAFAAVRIGDAEAAARELERGRLLTLDNRADLVAEVGEPLKAMGRTEMITRLEEALAVWSRLGQAVDSAPQGDQDPGPELADLLSSAERARRDLDFLLEEARELAGVASVPGSGDLPVLAACPLVYVAPLPWGTLLVAVLPDGGVEVEELPLTEGELGARWVKLVNSQVGRGSRRFRRALREFGAWQWAALIDPLLRRLDDPGEMVVVPMGLSAQLPLGIAFEADASAPGGRRYLGNRTVVRIAPSGRAARRSEEIRARELVGGSLVVTDPQPSPLPALHYSRVEAAAARLSSEQVLVLEGADASPDKVKVALGEHAVLHFICHAEASRSNPLASALILAGGGLSVGELLFARVAGSRLAILSACDTAVAGVEVPDEVVALPTAFLAIGCAGVIASYWPVGDLPTSLLIARFYETWTVGGMEPAEALPAAQLWLRTRTARQLRAFVAGLEERLPDGERHSLQPARRALRRMWPGSKPFRDPIHWAAFAYFGA